MYAEAENLLSSARYFEALHREELDFSDKQPGEVFACLTQNRTCGELISQDKTVYGEIPKCRECVSAQQNGRSSDRLCRFQDFRTFIFRRNVVKPSVGFLKYSYISNPEEFEPWLPTKSALQTSPEKLKLSAGKMLSNVGDCFCRIVREEQEVLDLHSKSCEVQNYKPSVAYKRLPPLVRDICDVCETTLFNLHWICKECGFGVCIDCYKENKADEERDPDDKALLRRRIWPPCTKENPDHCSTDLMLTQLIPGSLLFDMSEAMHALRDELKREWRAGQPVIVSNIGKRMDLSLWRPSKFSDDFGEEEHDLVNCLTDKVLVNQPMKKFWDGFDDKKKRMLCGNGLPMLLKLKDWPPGADFADVMPDRFRDVMQALPIPPFTRRDGIMNLASYLPSQFLPPDLGPKMYIAYGSAGNPMLGTTNLHLDISDAVNVMAYVGSSGELQDELKKATRALMLAGVDLSTLEAINETDRLPGALWHIYEAKDAPVIRRFLRKIAAEKGHRVKADSDPIHDQQTYLDDTLRERLREEYGVLGYGFVQCLGDAVFIPAGAPHQVRNLLNCIKVAEDFVSSETLEKCFELTKEFRRLSAAHANREDKLQIKNIVYQSIRQALSVLLPETILFVCVFVGIDFGPANMQRTEKHLDAALDAMIQRVTDLKNAIAQVIAKIDVERDTLKWPSLLDSYGLL
ncbi:unnamed protein product, partial [Notodromas monacha]